MLLISLLEMLKGCSVLQSTPAAILAANRDLPLDDPRLATGQAVCILSDICAAA